MREGKEAFLHLIDAVIVVLIFFPRSRLERGWKRKGVALLARRKAGGIGPVWDREYQKRDA